MVLRFEQTLQRSSAIVFFVCVSFWSLCFLFVVGGCVKRFIFPVAARTRSSRGISPDR